ncbi:MAG: hypothetical protein ABSH48_27170, partial [Verrucomicrobiota bacterium]
SIGWVANGPSGFTASGTGLGAAFTPAGCGSGTVEFSVTWQHICDAGQSTAFASAAFNVNCPSNCLLAGVSTNCAVGGTMLLTNTTAATNFCFNSPVAASVTNLITTNAQIVITMTYTNSAGAVTANCPRTYRTNTVPPMVVSNWWTVSGPGTYATNGPGLTANFTPTNGGRGIITFNLTYTNLTPCATNVLTAPQIALPFNVIQIANQCVATQPPNRTRTTVGVGEEVNLSLVGSPRGTFTWSTSAGSINPRDGTATRFTTPSNAANATVTVSYNGGSCPLPFTVVNPNTYYASNVTPVTGYGKNNAGAGMKIPLWLTPTNVSFYRVQIMEVPATSNLNVTGYFLNTNIWPTGPPLHDVAHGAGHWVEVGMDNLIGVDTAQTASYRQPWSDGAFTWPIPGAWQVTGDKVTNSFIWSNQTRSLTPVGTITVLKFGHTVTRNTNDVYTTVN